MYHMLNNGDLLDKGLLVASDGQLRASVSASLDGDLPDHSWCKPPRSSPAAALGVALPAFVAASCRPLISNGRPVQPRFWS